MRYASVWMAFVYSILQLIRHFHFRSHLSATCADSSNAKSPNVPDTMTKNDLVNSVNAKFNAFDASARQTGIKTKTKWFVDMRTAFSLK